jgi:nucleotide-binding universal stress UspA family protein
MFKHLLCPIDGSESSIEALDAAARFAADQHADLTICTVVDAARAAAMSFGDPRMTGACMDAMESEATAMLNDAAARVQGITAANQIALQGLPVDSIVEYAANNGCDLIVMGSHGRSGLSRALLGSVAEGVLRHATIPVMILRWSKHPSKAPAIS